MKRYNEPLGLPRGSVRAIVALLVAVPMPVLVILATMGRGIGGEIMAFYTAVVMMVLRDYFGSRQSETQQTPREESTTYTTGAQ